MKVKSIVSRELANQDVEQAVEYYLNIHEGRVASNFIDALEKAYDHLSSHPATGSPRYAQELNLAGLRAWQLKYFPYIIFYIEQDTYLDIWRVLHSCRDIPEWLQGN